jgi:hypothetical protein
MKTPEIFQRQLSVSHPVRGGICLLRAGRAVSSLAAAVAVAFCLTSGQARAEAKTGDLPAFLFQPLYSSHQGSVYGISSARHADLVLVAGGFDAGFRTGMVCRILDGAEDVAEVILVDVRDNGAAGLILQLQAGRVIEAGHSVRTKTVTF